MRFKSLCIILIGWFAASGASAARVDCSLIYDEFDSLMLNRFLVAPEDYVTTRSDRLSDAEFELWQRGRFKLYKSRGDSAVLIFRTTQNRTGKALYRWTPPLADGRRYLILDEVVWFARIADGVGPRVFGPLRANEKNGIDLDTATLVTSVTLEKVEANDELALAPETENRAADNEFETESDQSGELAQQNQPEPAEGFLPINSKLAPTEADLHVTRDEITGEYWLNATNGAVALFPLESLCSG